MYKLLLSVLFIAAAVRADILWPDCIGPANHGTIGKGNYYNVCIEDHDFTGEEHPWRFTHSKISRTRFESCTFANTVSNSMDFTETTWTSVEFHNCKFGSYNADNPDLTFTETVMTNVFFSGCHFHSSVILLFEKFMLNNVTFENCRFEGQTTFTLGTVNNLEILKSYFKRSPDALTPSGTDSLLFNQVLMRGFLLKKSEMVNPLKFEGVSAADVAINETTLAATYCHSPKEKEKILYYSGFNDTIFFDVEMKDKVECDHTTFKGLAMRNVTSYDDVTFANSDILDLYVDHFNSTSIDGTEKTLSFASSTINRRVFSNVTVSGKLDFSAATIRQVYIVNLFAAKPEFVDATFIDQEFIDGACCTSACGKLGCKCNMSDPSGQCPTGSYKVNTNVQQGCFPASATLQRENGLSVSMKDLELAQSVAVGGGEHSDVYFFGHKAEEQMGQFVSLHTTGTVKPLLITPNHYLYVNGRLATADTVMVGDMLRAKDGSDSLEVTQIGWEERRGLYAPTSMHGDLLVDGVVVSSYTRAVHPTVAHKLLQPLRLLYRYGFDSVVRRATMLHESSWASWSSRLGLAGPNVIEQ